MLKPPEPFELPDDNEVDVMLDSVFFKTFGLPGCEEKYPSPTVNPVVSVGGVLALEVFGDVIIASGL
jgi:hypothetical protein